MFSLRALTTLVIETSEAPDPEDLAEEVYQRLTPEEREAALREALKPYVREAVVQHRQRAFAAVRRREPTRSWKADGIRSDWERLCRVNVHIGHGKWKHLAQCTYEDLIAAAEERAKMASQIAAQAEIYRSYAERVQQAGVATFGDLTADDRQDILAA